MIPYLLGMCYENECNMSKAVKMYNICIALSPVFCLPYFNIIDIHMSNGRIEVVIELLEKIYNKPTQNDPEELPVYHLEHQLRICCTLLKCHEINNDDKKKHKVLKYLFNKLTYYQKRFQKDYQYDCCQIWKFVCMSIAEFSKTKEEKTYFLKKGLSGFASHKNMSYAQVSVLHTIDKKLREMLKSCDKYT